MTHAKQQRRAAGGSPGTENRRASEALAYETFDSPIGRIVVVAGVRGVCAIEFADHAARLCTHLERWFESGDFAHRGDPAGALPRLHAYFAGDASALDDLPVDPHGTPFQLAVWKALRDIPTGETRSYADIARTIGRPAAVRAVGAANGSNPIAIAVPCHRVIGSDGSLTGYGGGIERKRWLLTHEGAKPARAAAQGVLPIRA